MQIPQEHGGREAPGDTPISKQKKLNWVGNEKLTDKTNTGSENTTSTSTKHSREPMPSNSTTKQLLEKTGAKTKKALNKSGNKPSGSKTLFREPIASTSATTPSLEKAKAKTDKIVLDTTSETVLSGTNMRLSKTKPSNSSTKTSAAISLPLEKEKVKSKQAILAVTTAKPPNSATKTSVAISLPPENEKVKNNNEILVTTSKNASNERRFSFKLGGSLRKPLDPEQSEIEPRDINGKRKTIPFLQLGRLVPYEDRNSIRLDHVPSFSTILQKKRRHSSDKEPGEMDENILKPLNKAPRIEEDVTTLVSSENKEDKANDSAPVKEVSFLYQF